MDEIKTFLEKEIADYEKEAETILRKFAETTERIRILKEIRATLNVETHPDRNLTSKEIKAALSKIRQAGGKETPRCRKTYGCWKAKVNRNGIYVDGRWVNSIDLSKYMGTWLIVQENERGIDLFTLKGRYLFSIYIPTSHELDWSEAIKRIRSETKRKDTDTNIRKKVKVCRNGVQIDEKWVNSFELSIYRGDWVQYEKKDHVIDFFSLNNEYLFSIDL